MHALNERAQDPVDAPAQAPLVTRRFARSPDAARAHELLGLIAGGACARRPRFHCAKHSANIVRSTVSGVATCSTVSIRCSSSATTASGSLTSYSASPSSPADRHTSVMSGPARASA